MSAAQERWRPVIGYEGYYEVSTEGRVRGVARRARSTPGGVVEAMRGVPAKVRRAKNCPRRGHLVVELSREGIARRHVVNTLVLEAFVGARPSGGHIVDFINGDPGDCRLANLRWTKRPFFGRRTVAA